ncbi:probable dolichyl pyrophosphate Glc1Man9GlcNAc2 alpha-1,3-glucosyltransferase [Microplitis mediator]|uniref:probable dolichyl pyrophosphate Glc1Man9GlcNAc2 alpha-1,3-glucosyltransferase n=1 Tax=Microplitis mediator TaxID=375433 RepID=UPI002554D79C|nr:probable dolichyl pyrophosphate Glc1Man9GlcNAc2 alpha-1,3-glucosyltransferase [Microplitis mediator]
MAKQLKKKLTTNTNTVILKSDQLKSSNELIDNKGIYAIFILVSAIKFLLIPTYHSTDFEVHRNWLAITHSLPIKEWYINAKSEWTLDYPPFFAWFEFFLSQIAKYVDPEMLKIDNLNYESPGTIIFQRTTVIIADFIFLYGVIQIGRVFCTSQYNFMAFGCLSLCNIGLLVIDHIHFQYNGFLLGILLLSIARVCKNESISILQGAAWFAILLNLKHIYLYVAPAFIVWLLKWYCFKDNKFFTRLIQLGMIVITITFASFGPFMSQLPQVLARLFPFKRGLVHAYWAANAWAVYIGADKALSLIWKRFGWISGIKTAAMTGGLVQEDSLTILPTPTPLVTFAATFISMLPALFFILKRNHKDLKPEDFLRCIVLCALSSFIFGWHVHEKAILTAIIPLSVLAALNINDGRIFIILSTAGHTAILPLLFTADLILLKILMHLVYMSAVILCLQELFNSSLLKIHEWIYVTILPFITIYETLIHRIIFQQNLPFLPLALTSIYCAIGVIYSWIFYYYVFYTNCTVTDIESMNVKTNQNVQIISDDLKKKNK